MANRSPQVAPSSNGNTLGVQDLRSGFRAAVSRQGTVVQRAEAAIEYADSLRTDIDSGSTNSKLFFESMLAMSHSALIDFYRGRILASPPEESSELRVACMHHLLGKVAANKKIQTSIAVLLIDNPDLPTRKHLTRILGIANSAEEVILGSPDHREGRVLINGLVAEHKVLYGLRAMGLEDARYGTVKEDVYRGEDIVVPPTSKLGQVALQVKSIGRPGKLGHAHPSRGAPVVYVGLNPEDPLKLSERQADKLHGFIEAERAAA